MKTRLTFILPFICLIFGGSLAFADGIVDLKAKAEKGDAKAQFSLAMAYFDGEGVIKDEVEAVKWLRKSAEQGDALSQFLLGTFYYEGNGVIKDEVEAVKWYRKSADQGHAMGQALLGECYYEGNGVIKDIIQAHAWCNLASARVGEMVKKIMITCEKDMTPDQIAEATKLARELDAKIKNAKDKKK